MINDNTMKKTITSVGLLFISITNTLAHPGPIGHTHDDDWPFDLLMILGSIAVVVFLAKRFLYKRG